MDNIPLYRRLASVIDAYHRCQEKAEYYKKNDMAFHVPNALDWARAHSGTAYKLTSEHMPSGSGIDRGCELDLQASSGEKLVFIVPFHHMDENGYYDDWTEHKVIVRPSMPHELSITVRGKDRNGIKEYLHGVLMDALMKEVPKF